MLIVLAQGIGDTFAFLIALPAIRAAHEGEELKIAALWADAFRDEAGITLVEWTRELDPTDSHNVYRYMELHNWQDEMWKAYVAMHVKDKTVYGHGPLKG